MYVLTASNLAMKRKADRSVGYINGKINESKTISDPKFCDILPWKSFRALLKFETIDATCPIIVANSKSAKISSTLRKM